MMKKCPLRQYRLMSSHPQNSFQIVEFPKKLDQRVPREPETASRFRAGVGAPSGAAGGEPSLPSQLGTSGVPPPWPPNAFDVPISGRPGAFATRRSRRPSAWYRRPSPITEGGGQIAVPGRRP